MKIYALTRLGKRLARSTSNPDTANWRIVHYLDGTGHNTSDQIANYTGISEGEVTSALAQLRRKGIVQEISSGGGY